MTVLSTLMLSGLLTVGQAINPPPGPMQQGQQGRGLNQPNQGPNAPIRELQEVFDAFALVQAQRVLQLDDEQYGRFFPRMSRVYQLRRQHGQLRLRVVNEIRRLYGPQQGADAALAEAVERLDALEAKFGADMRAARQAVDEVLTVRQRAGLRFFEEDMERQKIDFITRSRQGGVARQGGGGA